MVARAVKRIAISIGVIVFAVPLIPLLPDPLGAILGISLMFIGLPVLIVLVIDLGKILREAPGLSRQARILGFLLSFPQATLGVLSLLLGCSILAWAAYNFLIERQREFTGGSLPSLGIGPALITCGYFWMKSAFTSAGHRADGDT